MCAHVRARTRVRDAPERNRVLTKEGLEERPLENEKMQITSQREKKQFVLIPSYTKDARHKVKVPPDKASACIRTGIRFAEISERESTTVGAHAVIDSESSASR